MIISLRIVTKVINMDILQNDRTIDILEFPIYIERKGCVEKMLIPDYLEGKHLYSKRDFFLVLE